MIGYTGFVRALYHCYTDGSCKKSSGEPGGWGVFIRCPDGRSFESSGGEIGTTPLKMELSAIVAALELLPGQSRAVIYSDSHSALDHCSKHWKTGCPQSLPLLKLIDLVIREKALEVEWKWIRGHNGNEGNERADALAAAGARNARKKLDDGK